MVLFQVVEVQPSQVFLHELRLILTQQILYFHYHFRCQIILPTQNHHHPRLSDQVHLLSLTNSSQSNFPYQDFSS